MIQNLLKIALRNFHRERIFSLLQVLGLSLGISSCLLISLYAIHEFSFDSFHEKGDRIYRINQTFIWGDEDALFGSTGPAVMYAIQQEVPEFESMVRVHTPGPFLVKTQKNQLFEEKEILAVDSAFFQIFTFPLVEGNAHTALKKPYSIILTESAANKYFGDESALGKTLELSANGNTKSYLVTGIATDIPTNSHIDFNMLISMNSIPNVRSANDSWMWTTFVTFGLLREGADPRQTAKKVAKVPGKYLDKFLQKYRGISLKEFLESGEEWNLYIQPFNDIHLRSTHVFSRLNQTGDIRIVGVFILIAALTLLISVINFINLYTARATTRAKEVGIRKVIGSDRKMLISQFLAESILYVFLSMALSIIIVELFLPTFNYLTEKDLSFQLLLEPTTLAVMIASIAIVGILAGIYPSLYMSSFRPAQVLKGKIGGTMKGGGIRNILVTTQFTISIALISSTLIVHQQVEHWRTMDVGFDRENKIIIENIETLGASYPAFLNNIEKYALVERASYSSDVPPYIFDFDNFSIKGGEKKSVSVNYLLTDEDFIPSYGIVLIAGRNFSREFKDSLNVIVSRKFTEVFEFTHPETALNRTVTYNNKEFHIIGVFEDFNANLSDEVYPTAILSEVAPIFSNPNKSVTISLNRDTSGDELNDLLSNIEKEWNTFNDQMPLQYTFTDQEFMAAFSDTIRFATMLKSFTSLAIIIACLGLIGLVTFIIEKRHKEIGIRKVLGASMNSIFVMLATNFGKLLLIGLIISTPITWTTMSRWIENYPEQITISWITFILAGLIMFLFSVLAVSIQMYRASNVNPVKYLKEE